MTGKRDPAKLSDNERVERARLAKDHAAWSARIAEYEGSQSVADIVAQLRRRARVANTRAIGVLIVLIMAVLFGLAAYVVWPVVRQYVDGQRAELQRALEAIEAADEDLSRDRNTTIGALGASLDSLGDVVTGGVPFDQDVVVYGNTGHFELSDGGLIIYGRDGGLLRIGQDGNSFDEFLTNESRFLEGYVALGNGAHLLYGSDGIFRINEDGQTYETLFFREQTTFFNHYEREDGSYLLFGDHTIAKVDEEGELATALTPPSDNEYQFILPLTGGGYVLYGWQGAVLLGKEAQSATVIASVPDVFLNEHIQLDDGTFVVYGDGVALAIDKNGQLTRKLDVEDTNRSYYETVLTDGTVLTTNGKDIYRAGPNDFAFEVIDTDLNFNLEGFAVLEDKNLLMYGREAVLRINALGEIVETVMIGENQQLYNHVVQNDGTVLIYGRGSIYKYDPTTQKTEESFVQGDVTFSRSASLKDGSIIIYGSGRVLHAPQGSGSIDILFSSAEDIFFSDKILEDGSTLLFGGSSALIIEGTGQTAELLASLDSQSQLLNVAQLQDGATVIYGRGSIVSISPDRSTIKQHTLPVDAGLGNHFTRADGRLLMYGSKGAVFAYDPKNQDVERMPSGTLAPFEGHALLKDGSAVFYSVTGAASKFPGSVTRDFDDLLASIRGFSQPDQDQAIRVFLQEDLANYDFDEKDAALNQINTIIAQRTVLATRKLETQATQDDLPTGAYFLQQQRQSFRQFMQDCRGVTPVAVGSAQAGTPQANGVAGDPDEITLACTQAWMKKLEAEAGTWWQTLAQQIPPGILLLFLLATLGALYRYNLRLAGFHASRADLLELMSMGQPSSKNMFVEWDKDNFSRITEALAADKVEFGKGTLPTDQAISMAQAMLNR
ncbi:MAG: hypothetical protein AAGL23_09720 [Pseudomonadota bacterium]